MCIRDSINIARPGDKTRIICIQDVMQPRCRENGNNFPGFVDKMQIVGNGRTVSLDGAGVIISNPESTRIEMGVLDMDGPMAGLCLLYTSHQSAKCGHGKHWSERLLHDGQ